MKKKSREERHQFYMKREKEIDAYFTGVNSVVKQSVNFIQSETPFIEECDVTKTSSALWTPLAHHARLEQTLSKCHDRIDEEPCLSIAAFLGFELSNIAQGLLRAGSSTILVQGNNAQICISASVSLDEVREILELSQ